MKRNGAHFGFDIRPDQVSLVRQHPSGISGASRPLDTHATPEQREAAIAAALRELALELRVGRHAVDFTVPRAEAMEKRLTLPIVSPAELESLVRFQLAKDLPLDLEALTVAWTPMPGEPGSPTLSVHCVAVRTEVIDRLQLLASQAGVKTGRMLIGTEAAARGLYLSGGSKGRPLLLDLHPGATDIVVLDEGRLVFSRTSSYGPGQADWQDKLAGELARTLISAEATCGGPPDSLFLAGSDADDRDLTQELLKRLGLDPQPLPSLGAGQDGSSFAAARGLADPTPTPGIPTLDLAHAARTQHSRRQKQQLVAAGIGFAALALLALFLVQSSIRGREDEVAKLRLERDQLTPRARQATLIARELTLADAWSERKGRELEVLLAVTRALPADQAYLTQLRWTEGGDLQLGGRAKEWEVVGRFFAALGHDPLIESADFADVRRPREKGALGYVFTGSARLVEAPR